MATVNTISAAGNQLSAEIKTYYDMKLIIRLLPSAIHAQYGTKRSIPKGGGTKINMRRFESLTTPSSPTQLTEGINPVPLPVTVTSVEITPGQYGDYIQHTDRLELQAIDNTVEDFIDLIQEHAARVFDIVVRNPLIAATNVILCGNKALETDIDDNSRLNVLNIKRAARLLDGNNCKMYGEQGGSYVALAHIDALHDLTLDPAWEIAHRYGKPQALFKNEVGMIGGTRFVKSTQVYVNSGGGSSTAVDIVGSRKNTGGTAANVYYTTVLSLDAYACVDFTGEATPEIIVHNPGTAGAADALNLNGTMGFKGYQGCGIIDDDRLVIVKSSASL